MADNEIAKEMWELKPRHWTAEFRKTVDSLLTVKSRELAELSGSGVSVRTSAVS